jgi:hypothetical protein
MLSLTPRSRRILLLHAARVFPISAAAPVAGRSRAASSLRDLRLQLLRDIFPGFSWFARSAGGHFCCRPRLLTD